MLIKMYKLQNKIRKKDNKIYKYYPQQKLDNNKLHAIIINNQIK